MHASQRTKPHVRSKICAAVRAFVLGANDGLVSVASLMLGEWILLPHAVVVIPCLLHSSCSHSIWTVAPTCLMLPYRVAYTQLSSQCWASAILVTAAAGPGWAVLQSMLCFHAAAGVGAASSDLRTMQLSGVAGLVAGALSMACGEAVLSWA